MTKINVSELSNTFQAFLNCDASNEWKGKHEDHINKMLESLPHGSGIDAGVDFSWEASRPERLVFEFGFHHMDEHGGYDGWTAHLLVLKPSFTGIDMKITGRDRNQIKDYLYQVFHETFFFDHLYQLKRNESNHQQE